MKSPEPPSISPGGCGGAPGGGGGGGGGGGINFIEAWFGACEEISAASTSSITVSAKINQMTNGTHIVHFHLP